MLPIHINGGELYDPINNCFIPLKETTIKLEHSLLSISKWESKWLKPFLTNDPKTIEERKDYICCMSISGDIDPRIIQFISNSDMQRITDYIGAKMTATCFSNLDSNKKSSERMTSELIYYLMIAYGIPMECEKWHLSRLLTLIEICELKNSPPKKMSQSELIAQNKELNAKRKAALKSKG